MAGMGTGTPNYFYCPEVRKVWFRNRTEWLYRHHVVHRTGRTKPNYSSRRTQRTLGEQHEFVCSCGHRGWSRISGILEQPLIGERRGD